MGRADIGTAPKRRRGLTRGARRATAKPSLSRWVWALLRHAALAVVMGLGCGVLAARIGGMIRPPYAAILGTLVAYPALVATWRRLPRPWRRRR